MRVHLTAPKDPDGSTGNAVTVRRWERVLASLGHDVRVVRTAPAEGDGVAGSADPAAIPDAGTDAEAAAAAGQPELLVALHARRSAGAALSYRRARPDGRLVVALTGTDLYRDLDEDGHPEARAAVEAADRLVVLQEKALERLPPRLRERARVIHQSCEPPEDPPRPRSGVFEVSVLCHMRPVKDPFLAADAARLLPAASRVEVVHAGAALSPEAEQRARREDRTNPRWRWLGPLERAEALRLLARSRLMAITSRSEGGANVVTEALACGTPVVATRVEGSVGLLGEDYPGYVPVGDAGALAEALRRCETDPDHLAELEAACRARSELASPERERSAWRELIGELARSP